MELISALVAPGWSRKENHAAVVLVTVLTDTRELRVHMRTGAQIPAPINRPGTPHVPVTLAPREGRSGENTSPGFRGGPE